MAKPKLVLYAQDLANCPCHDRIFGHDFEIVTTEAEGDLLKKVRDIDADVAVLCFCSAEEEDVEVLSRINSLTGPIPVLACSKTYNLEFVRLAAQRGVNHFIVCNMELGKIRSLILSAIRGTDLRTFLESCCPGSVAYSPYVGKMITEIVHAFPHRMTTGELSRRLGITGRRLQMICQQEFGKTFTQLMRRIWVYQALIMMKNTNLDDTEIAFQLEYSDESSLARIFRKELGCNPTEARNRLLTQSPEELLA
jgi:AraC-like DNA-binding protein